MQEQIENVDEAKDYTEERAEFKNLYFYRLAHIMSDYNSDYA